MAGSSWTAGLFRLRIPFRHLVRVERRCHRSSLAKAVADLYGICLEVFDAKPELRIVMNFQMGREVVSTAFGRALSVKVASS